MRQAQYILFFSIAMMPSAERELRCPEMSFHFRDEDAERSLIIFVLSPDVRYEERLARASAMLVI